MKVSLPLLRVLRIVDGDEKPAMPEVMAAMDYAKERIKAAIADKPTLVKKVIKIVEDKWESQMGVKLYGAALFLNPNRIYGLKAKPEKAQYCQRLRHMFNEVLLHMEPDDDKGSVISRLADDYERGEGECFSSKLGNNDRTKKSPLLWWGAYGGLAYELQHLAKHIVSLCASASGCERNWSCFQNIHSKKRNRLEFQRLNDLSYVQYSRKNADRFQKIREEGSKGTRSDPLVLEDLQWDNEWVDHNAQPVYEGADITWAQVDEAVGASEGPLRNLRSRGSGSQAAVTHVHSRSRVHQVGEDEDEEDDAN
uniref:HAT C-terminal dimerisation domain-containing protein n=2 Tax=Triticum urartu TaxID=4572 RepID=A0A8R7PJW7_TRIUA